MGSLGGAAVWRLPLAQGAILETRDRIPRRAPSAWSLLLPLPVSLTHSLSLSLCVCVSDEKNKILKRKKRNQGDTDSRRTKCALGAEGVRGSIDEGNTIGCRSSSERIRIDAA